MDPRHDPNPPLPGAASNEDLGPRLDEGMEEPPRVYGLVAEFLHPEEIVEAAEAAYEHGYRQMDAYSPMPVEGLAEAIGFRRNRLPMIVLIAGICGGLGGFFMQWFSATIHYPIIVGGRPFNSWPSFMPITFELTVLISAFAAVLGMLGLNGLPRPHHPIFNAPGFALASRSRFFLCIQSNDPLFDPEKTRLFLRQHHAHEISVVHF
jgi:hypothetical protein